VKVIRIIAISIVGFAAILSVGADWLAPHDYAAQFRQHANEPPSQTFPLGTDDLGRDRFSRLLQGSRISLFCAPLGALIATVLAAAVGVISGYLGGWVDGVLIGLTDLFLSLPWFFALLTLRALLPLNISSWQSIAATFLLLAVVGWPSCARVIRAGTAAMRRTGPILHARAYGCSGLRLLLRHVLPSLRPVLSAQFWVLVPTFLLAEANLGILGLGIVEPLPSLGNLLAELQNYERIRESPWVLAPAVLLVSVVASLHFLVSGRKAWE
jgi:peptide/nickel transport system permease protein